MTTKQFFSCHHHSIGLRNRQMLLLFVLVLGLTACGIKKDPVPIAEPKPLAVTDLAHTIKDETVTLTWTLPKGQRFRSYVAGFVVYKSKEDVKKERCTGCPILFSPVADMPVDINRQGGDKTLGFTFSEPLEKGFRYIYKVTIYLKSGTVSDDSNLIEFTF
jgi:hypothetical protein